MVCDGVAAKDGFWVNLIGVRASVAESRCRTNRSAGFGPELFGDAVGMARGVKEPQFDRSAV
jgi:hypothetical protein